MDLPILARTAVVYRLDMLQQGQSGCRYWSILRSGGRSSSGRDSGDPKSPVTNPLSSSCLLNGLSCAHNGDADEDGADYQQEPRRKGTEKRGEEGTG